MSWASKSILVLLLVSCCAGHSHSVEHADDELHPVSADESLGEESPDRGRSSDTDFAPLLLIPGTNLGGGTADRGFIVGGDLAFAVVWLDEDTSWIGMRADALYSFGAEAVGFGVGPEFVLSIFGIDFCYAGDVVGSEYRHATKLRGTLNLRYLGIYSRWVHIYDDVENPDFFEIGVVLTLPLIYKAGRWRIIPLGK